jgi:hypothetical protein
VKELKDAGLFSTRVDCRRHLIQFSFEFFFDGLAMSIAALPTEHSMHNITKHESTWNFNSSTPQSIAFASVGTRSASFVSAPNADVNRTSKGDGAAWNWAGSTKLHSDEQNSVLEPNSEVCIPEICFHLLFIVIFKILVSYRLSCASI